MKDLTEDLLTGTKLRLRAPEPEDIDLLYKWENDTRVWRVSNTFAPFSRFQLEEFVMNSRQDIFSARQVRLMIDKFVPAEEKTTIGSIDLFDFDPFHLRAGVGILIREEFRNEGYAKEALEILIRYAFTLLQLHQLYCNISAENTISCSLFESLGFVNCGIKREWINQGERWQDEIMLQLINK